MKSILLITIYCLVSLSSFGFSFYSQLVWEKPNIYYYFMKDSRTPSLLKQSEEIFARANKIIGRKFFIRTNDYKSSDIRIRFREADIYSNAAGHSLLGQGALREDKETPTFVLNYDGFGEHKSLDESHFWHELLHVGAFVHEFQSPQFNLYQINNQAFWGEEAIYQSDYDESKVESKDDWIANYKILSHENVQYSFYDPYSVMNYYDTEDYSIEPIRPALREDKSDSGEKLYLSYLDTLGLKYLYNPKYKKTKVKESFIHLDNSGFKNNLGNSKFSDVSFELKNGQIILQLYFGHQAFVFKRSHWGWGLLNDSDIYVNGLKVDNKLFEERNLIFDYLIPGANEIIIQPRKSILPKDFLLRLEFDELEYSFSDYGESGSMINQDSGYHYFAWLNAIKEYNFEPVDSSSYFRNSSKALFSEDKFSSFLEELNQKREIMVSQEYTKILSSLPVFSKENVEKKNQDLKIRFEEYDLMKTIEHMDFDELLEFFNSMQFISSRVIKSQKPFKALAMALVDSDFDVIRKSFNELKRARKEFTETEKFYLLALLPDYERNFNGAVAVQYFELLLKNFGAAEIFKIAERFVSLEHAMEGAADFFDYWLYAYIDLKIEKLPTKEICDGFGHCSYSKFLKVIEESTILLWSMDTQVSSKLDLNKLFEFSCFTLDDFCVPLAELFAKHFTGDIVKHLQSAFTDMDPFLQLSVLELLKARNLLNYEDFARAGLLDVRDKMFFEDGQFLAENSRDYMYLRAVTEEKGDLQDAFVDWLKLANHEGDRPVTGFATDFIKKTYENYGGISSIYEEMFSKPCDKSRLGRNANWYYMSQEWFLPFRFIHKSRSSFFSNVKTSFKDWFVSKDENDLSLYCEPKFDYSSELLRYILATGDFND